MSFKKSIIIFFFILIAFQIKASESNLDANEALPELNLLLEGNDLLTIRALIRQLRDNQQIKKGLLLHGPAGCGKNLLAKIIAHRTDKELISTLEEEINLRLEDSIKNNTEVESTFGDDDNVVNEANNNNQPNNAKQSNNANEKNSQVQDFKAQALRIALRKLVNSLGILVIYNIEEYLDQDDFDTVMAYGLNKPRFLIIGTTHSSELQNNNKIKRFLTALMLKNPTYSMRKEIITFYSDRLCGEHIDPSSYLLDVISTATEGLSGSEIEDIITKASQLFNEEDVSNINPSRWTYARNSVDLKNRRGFIDLLHIPLGLPLFYVICTFCSDKVEKAIFYAIELHFHESNNQAYDANKLAAKEYAKKCASYTYTKTKNGAASIASAAQEASMYLIKSSMQALIEGACDSAKTYTAEVAVRYLKDNVYDPSPPKKNENPAKGDSK